MNKARRKRISDLIEKLTTAFDELAAVIEEEQEAYDNLPESLQESERGEAMYDGISTLEDAGEDIQNVVDSLSEYFQI